MKYIGFVLLILNSMLVQASISGKSTHSVAVSNSSVYLNEGVRVSWSPKSGYTGINYSSYMVRIYPPTGGAYNDNTSSTAYNISLNKLGRWCFKIRSRANGQLSAYSNSACTTVKEKPLPNITGISTHNTSISQSSAFNGDTVQVSWWPKSSYNKISYSSYIARIYPPTGGAYNHEPGSSTSFNLPLTEAGQWCVKVRARAHGKLGAYSNSACVNVANYDISNTITHEITTVNSVNTALDSDDPNYVIANDIKAGIEVKWNAKASFRQWPFGSFRLHATKPDGETETFYVPGGNSYTIPAANSQAGKWTFKVRAYLNGLGAYSAPEEHDIEFVLLQKESGNLLGEGSFVKRSPTYWRGEGKDGFDEDETLDPPAKKEFYPFSRHAFHIGGNYRSDSDTLVFTSYRLPGKAFSQYPLNLKYSESGVQKVTVAKDEADLKKFCRTHGFSNFRCRKSEVSFAPHKYNGYASSEVSGGDKETGANIGTHSWLAYRFRINNWYTENECITKNKTTGEDQATCKMYISQFHYQSTEFDDYAPLNAIDLRAKDKSDLSTWNKPILSLTTKSKTKHSGCSSIKTNTYSCSVGDSSEYGNIEIGKYYNVVLHITWSDQTDGLLEAWYSDDDGESYKSLGSKHVPTNITGYANNEKDKQVKLFFGMYMGDANGDLVNTREQRNEEPVSIEFEEIFMAQERNELPSKYHH